LGVKFSLILAVFSGFAEIVPIIGPIVAAAVVAIVAFMGGTSNFGLAPLQIAQYCNYYLYSCKTNSGLFHKPLYNGKNYKLTSINYSFCSFGRRAYSRNFRFNFSGSNCRNFKIIFEYSLDKVNDKR
jgi:hypothetical protein